MNCNPIGGASLCVLVCVWHFSRPGAHCFDFKMSWVGRSARMWCVRTRVLGGQYYVTTNSTSRLSFVFLSAFAATSLLRPRNFSYFLNDVSPHGARFESERGRLLLWPLLFVAFPPGTQSVVTRLDHGPAITIFFIYRVRNNVNNKLRYIHIDIAYT
jgi:hypothetical protein